MIRLLRLFIVLLLLSFNVFATENTPSSSLDNELGGRLIGGVHYDLPSWFKSSFLDIADDVADAAEKSKHVLLFIHQDNCPYCSMMIKEGFKNSVNTNTIKEEFEAVAIDIRGGKEVSLNKDISMSEAQTADYFNVRFTPTIIFLNHDNEVVYKVNGYRGTDAFGKILSYVKGKSYEYMSLEDYIDKDIQINRYEFVQNDRFIEENNLYKLSKDPLMLIIEDTYCENCYEFHENILTNKKIDRLMGDFNVVRLDAESNQKIIDPTGKKTTINNYVRSVGLTYRPGVLLFDNHKEVARIDGLLYNFHFGEILRYVGGKFYQKYSGNFKSYIANRTLEILSNGVNVNLGK